MIKEKSISEEDFVLLLEDRAFVDYFNIYSSLPIFGQHVLFNFLEKEFSYEPPIIKRKNYVDKRRVVTWLCKERYPGFTRSRLFVEYILCNKIRDVRLPILIKDSDDVDEVVIFTRNILGSAIGMQIFRESLVGTAGETTYKCWLDLEKLRRTPPGEQRYRLLHYIKNTYLTSEPPHDLGKLNFDPIPDEAIQKELINGVGCNHVFYNGDSIDTFKNLQALVLAAIRTYWVPRYLLGILRTTPKSLLAVLKRGSPYDKMALNQQRQLRCSMMFPSLYPEESPTKHIEMEHHDDLNTRTTNSCSTLSSASTEFREVNINDFLMISGGFKLVQDGQENTPDSAVSSQNVSPESLIFSGSDDARDITFPTPAYKTPSFTVLRPTLDIPPFLSSYITGTTRISTGRKPKSKVMVALAAENLAGSPMRALLQSNEDTKNEKLLRFWEDVRQYLESDQSHRDEFGNAIKAKLAHLIFERYLSSASADILPESMKMNLVTILSNEDDASLLMCVQDFISESLKHVWKSFLTFERNSFRRKVCGGHYYDKHVVEYPEDTKDPNDPLILFSTSIPVSPESVSPDYRPKSGCISGFGTPWSRSSAPSTVPLTDEQTMKAFEFTVALSEYGRPVLLSYDASPMSAVIDALYSDYGSLHINKLPVTRHYHLHKLIHKPKIDIANLKVSKDVLFETTQMSTKPTNEDDNFAPRGCRLVMRRNAVILDRPERPRTFMECLTTVRHLEYFKRFMAGQKMQYPLAFWKHIEELRNMPGGRMRMNMKNNILRKYFGKGMRSNVLLDCNDDIIRQIPMMEKVSMGVLKCAQGSVFRSMERKWYPRYLETCAPDPTSDGSEIEIPVTVVENTQHVSRFRKSRRIKVMRLWRSFLSVIIKFLKAMKDPYETRLFELYLRKELYKTPKPKPNSKEVFDISIFNTPYTPFQTRIVLRNRLIIVDKLQRDLRFWCEANRYIDQVDNLQKMENVEQDHLDLIKKQANTIVDVYLDSEIPPRNQLNIPSDLAQSIVSSMQDSGGPTRGLFHDALITVFPLLYFFWNQCQKEWLKRHTAVEFLQLMDEQKFRLIRPSTPHKGKHIPDFLSLRASQIDVTSLIIQDENTFSINFSLLGGCQIIVPLSRGQKGLKNQPSETSKDKLKSEDGHSEDKKKNKQRRNSKQREKVLSTMEEEDIRMSQNSTPNHNTSNYSSPHKRRSKVKSLKPQVITESTPSSRIKTMDMLVKEAVEDDIAKDLLMVEEEEDE